MKALRQGMREQAIESEADLMKNDLNDWLKRLKVILRLELLSGFKTWTIPKKKEYIEGQSHQVSQLQKVILLQYI